MIWQENFKIRCTKPWQFYTKPTTAQLIIKNLKNYTLFNELYYLTNADCKNHTFINNSKEFYTIFRGKHRRALNPKKSGVMSIIYNKHRETYIIYRRWHKERAILFWATKPKYYFLQLIILPKSSINVNIPHFPRKNIIFYLSFILLFTNFALSTRI